MRNKTARIISKEASRLFIALGKKVPQKRLKRRLKKMWNKLPWDKRESVKHQIRVLHSSADVPSSQ